MSNVAKRYSWVEEENKNNVNDTAIDNTDEYLALLAKAYEVDTKGKVLVCTYQEDPDDYCLCNYYYALTDIEKELYVDIAKRPLPQAQLGIHDEALMRVVTATQNEGYYLLDASATWDNTPWLWGALSVLFEDYREEYNFPREEYWNGVSIRSNSNSQLSPLGRAAWEFLSGHNKNSRIEPFDDDKYLIAVVQRLGKIALEDVEYHLVSWQSEFFRNGYNGKVIPKHDFGSFIDPRDGEEYKTIKIGNKTWLAENFRYKPEAVMGWSQEPRDFEIYDEEYSYGNWYSWETVNNKHFCPSGWHLPTEEEINELLELNGENCLTIVNWWDSFHRSINKLGFSAQPAGVIIDDDEERMPKGQGCYAKYWINANKESKILEVRGYETSNCIKSINPARLALSVRLVKD